MADQWAYDRSDPHELYDIKTGQPFSTDLSHYLPLCHSCHRSFDRRNAWRFDKPPRKGHARVRFIPGDVVAQRASARTADLLGTML